MRLTHLDSGYPFYWPQDPAGFLCDAAEFRAWVAIDGDNQIVGHVALHQAEDDPALQAIQATQPAAPQDYAVLARLLVHPKSQGQGLGKLLLDAAVTHSFELDQHPILDVIKTSGSAILFYEALGWQRVGSMDIKLSDRPDIETWVYTAPIP